MYFTQGQIMLSEDWEYRSATQAGKKIPIKRKNDQQNLTDR